MSGHGRHCAPRTGRRRAGWVLAAGLPAVLGATAAYAVWTSGTTFASGVITAGDLQLIAGDLTWEQVTPGVADPASGSDADSLASLPVVPGDVIEVRQEVDALLRGDNLNGALAVRWADASGSATGVFHVEDEDGTQVAPATGDADFGTPLTFPDLVGTSTGVTTDLVVVMTVTVGGDRVYVTSDSPAPADLVLGDLDVELTQVRAGTGYGS